MDMFLTLNNIKDQDEINAIKLYLFDFIKDDKTNSFIIRNSRNISDEEKWIYSIINTTEEEAKQILGKKGYTLTIKFRDGEFIKGTDEADEKKVTAVVHNKKIIWIMSVGYK